MVIPEELVFNSFLKSTQIAYYMLGFGELKRSWLSCDYKYLINRYEYNLHQHIFVMVIKCPINYLYIFFLITIQYINIICSFLKGYLDKRFLVHMKITIVQDDFCLYKGKLDCTVNFQLYLWYCYMGNTFFF